MANPSQGTKLEISTGPDEPSAVTITDITIGYPTILESVEHGLKRGDVVTMANFSGTDAADINGEEFVVRYVTEDTFAIILDSSELDITDNSDAATATPVKWTEVGEVLDGDRAAGERTEIDTTHLRSTAKEYLLGLKDSGSYTFNMNWLFDDNGQNALLVAEGSDDTYDFKVTYPSDNTLTFKGLVKGVTGPAISVDGKMEGSATIKITGEVTFE